MWPGPITTGGESHRHHPPVNVPVRSSNGLHCNEGYALAAYGSKSSDYGVFGKAHGEKPERRPAAKLA